MTPEEALMRLLAESAITVGMGHNAYIVGGAVRDFVLGFGIKDLDVVVEPCEGKTTTILAEEVAKRLKVGCFPDQYGVVHLGPVAEDILFQGVNLKGQKVEMVTTRKEKYDRSKKDSHKPSEVMLGTLLEDLARRDFTIGTLMWRLGDLLEGPEGAPVIDLLGTGLEDLDQHRLQTPLNPSETFDEDPSRILRGVRFLVKYNLVPGAGVWEAFKSKSEELRRLPYEVVADIFIDKILTLPKAQARLAIDYMDDLGLISIIFDMVPKGRLKRGINGVVSDTRTLLKLMNLTSPAVMGHPLNKEEHRLLLEYSWLNSDEDLDALYQRFLKPPLDTRRLMKEANLEGPAIGQAVAKARSIVLRFPDITPEVLQVKVTKECTNEQ